MNDSNIRSNRIPGCESNNHASCYGELWQCSRCDKTVCSAEGGESDPDLCDDCWWAMQVENRTRRKGNAAPRSHPEPTTDSPDMETIAYWMFDGVAEATDGCIVEVDGVCPHGHRSWLRELGLI